MNMPSSFKCSFCNRAFLIGEGILYVKKDGSILRFCSSKCLKNSVKLGRNPRKVKWVMKGNVKEV